MQDLAVLGVIAAVAIFLLHSAMVAVAQTAYVAVLQRTQGKGDAASEGVYYSATINGGIFLVLFLFVYSYCWPELSASLEALGAPLVTAGGSLLLPAAALYAQAQSSKRIF